MTEISFLLHNDHRYPQVFRQCQHMYDVALSSYPKKVSLGTVLRNCLQRDAPPPDGQQIVLNK